MILDVVTLAAAWPTLKGATCVLVVTYPCSPQPEYLEFQKQDAGVKFAKYSRGARVLAASLVSVTVTVAPCASLLVPGIWDLPLPLVHLGILLCLPFKIDWKANFRPVFN